MQALRYGNKAIVGPCRLHPQLAGYTLQRRRRYLNDIVLFWCQIEAPKPELGRAPQNGESRALSYAQNSGSGPIRPWLF